MTSFKCVHLIGSQSRFKHFSIHRNFFCHSQQLRTHRTPTPTPTPFISFQVCFSFQDEFLFLFLRHRYRIATHILYRRYIEGHIRYGNSSICRYTFKIFIVYKQKVSTHMIYFYRYIFEDTVSASSVFISENWSLSVWHADTTPPSLPIKVENIFVPRCYSMFFEGIYKAYTILSR